MQRIAFPSRGQPRSWWALLGVLALTCSAAGAAQVVGPLPRELAWVGLFTPDLVRWLENENRLDELCDAPPGSVEWHACREHNMAPKLLVIGVYAAPEPSAARLGEIVVLAQPGRGLSAFASNGADAEPFTPDLFDRDWGYGPPWFHQTVLARRGTWFGIPVPLLGTGWIDVEPWIERGGRSAHALETHIERLEEGALVATPFGDMFVLGIDAGVLRVRPEQDADMWCDAGDPPPLAPWRERRIPFDELFDGQRHLRISYKYMRGC